MASLCSAPLLSGHLGLSSPRPARRRAAHRSARPFSARAAPLHQHQDPCCSSASWGPQLTAAHPRARIPSCRQGRRPARPAAAAGPDVSTGAAAESAIPAAPSTSSSGVSEAALAAAWVLLKEVTLKSFRGLGASYVATREKRQALRDAIQLIYRNPWPPAGWVAPAASSTAPAAPQQQPGEAAGPQPLGEQDTSPAAAPLVMIGLMASDVRVGARAMRDYCQALGLPYSKPESRVPGVASAAAVQGSVYLKYNSQSRVCYVSPYQGKERGVLLQLGVEQLGHLPLGLWDEELRNPPPPL